MGARFTESTDGVKRTSVRVIIRLSKEEVEAAKRIADKYDQDWRSWVASCAQLGVEGGMEEEDGSFEQRYGRGGD